MRKQIVQNIASMIYFAAATEATAPAERGQVQQPEGEKEVTPTLVPEGEKGKKGVVNPAYLAEAERQTALITDVLAAKEAIHVPADHESAEFKQLVVDMSNYAKATGDDFKNAKTSSAKAWPYFEALNPLKLNEKTGKPDLGKFCKGTWDLMTPEVKLEDPMKPGTFFAWNEARKYGNSAAMTIENVRNYVRNNGARLYPAYFPKEDENVVAERKKAAEAIAPFQKASKDVAELLTLTYLPAQKYVAIDEEGNPAPMEKAVTLADLLKALKKEIDAHLPPVEGEKEKVEKATEKQIDEQIKEHEEYLALLRKQKEEGEKVEGKVAGKKK